MPTRSRTLALLIAAIATVTIASGCKPGRTRAKFPAYKRLIATSTEVNALEARLADRRAVLAETGANPELLAQVEDLHAEVAQYQDQVVHRLNNRTRRKWHRTSMNACWRDYLKLYPEDRSWVRSYKNARR